MIVGIGVDTVEVDRFVSWHTKPVCALKRIFSDEEIAYCVQDSKRSAERFAVRFAAREAFYKSLGQNITHGQKIPFFTIMRAITVKRLANGEPSLSVDWEVLALQNAAIGAIIWHLTLTHTKRIATAIVIAENTSGSIKLI
jgi:holo-[acyl-carrier protein] synthase